MNNEQLIQLLRDKTPEELSLEEIELLRARLAESEELRQALFEQLQMEEYLAEALGRVDVSVDEIVVNTQPPNNGPHPMLLAVGLVVCLGVIGFISTIIILSLREPPAEVADARGDGDEDGEHGNGQNANINGQPSGEDPRAAAPRPPEPDPATVAALDAGQPKLPENVETARPPEPTGPWVAGLKAPPQAFDAVWFVDFDTDVRVPSREDLSEWFEPITGQPGRFFQEGAGNREYGAIDGVMKLKAPWPQDAALRFSTAKPSDFRVHAFAGENGVSIFSHIDPGVTLEHWDAHVTTRQDDKPLPETFAITATSDGRDYASEARYGPTLLLRWQDGYLVLTRGDVELVRAAMVKPPEEIYFAGKVVFRGIEMLRLKDAPPGPPAWPIAVDIEKPAELEWTTSLGEGAKLEKMPDGGVRLSADKARPLPFAATRLPDGGPRVIDIHLSDVSSGAGIYLSGPAELDDEGKEVQPAGRPFNQVLHLLREEGNDRLVARWNHFVTNRGEESLDPMEARVTPVVRSDVWVRFIAGAGVITCWVSPDGENWARLYRPESEVHGPLTHLGILTSLDVADSHLTVREIRTRPMPALAKLADDAVWQQAVALPAARNMGAWLIDVSAQQPSDVDTFAWRRACALKTVNSGCAAQLGQALLASVLQDDYVQALSAEEQLAVLDEVALLANPWQNLPSGEPLDLPRRYVEMARRAAIDGTQQPHSLVQRRLMTYPATQRHRYKALDAELIRRELLDLLYAGDWAGVDRFGRQLRFYAGDESNLRSVAPLAAWAQATASRHLPTRVGEGIARQESGWQHPLVEQYNKEAYNVMAEFHAAVESQSYEDAAEMIANLDPYGVEGLVPGAGDAQLLVSVPTAIQSAMRRDAQLAATMNADEFAGPGRLRVNRAINAGDEAAVRLATVQYHGTEAGGRAQRWMGDRALSGGEFLKAIDHYERAMENVGVLEKTEIATRMRLAAAMLGQEYGQPPTTPVTFGDVRMSAQEFESLVTEMRTTHAGQQTGDEIDISGGGEHAPRPSGFAVHRRGRLDGEPGESPNQVDGRVRNYDVPWLARQLGVTVHENIAYVNNRFHVAAYDLNNNGNRLWQSPPPPDRGRAHDWSLTSMRPVVVGDRLFVRQLTKQGPMLLCLDRANGQHVWKGQPPRGDEVVSDPVYAQGKLAALVLSRTGRGNDQLLFSLYAADTGELLETRFLVEVRDAWRQRRICRATQLPDGMLASLGGLVINVDLAGNLRWVRRQVVLPASSEEPTWVVQRMDRPLVVGDSAYVTSPGVRAVECLDVDTGGLNWRRTLPFIDRLVGLADDVLVVHVGDEFLGLDAASGDVRWRRKILAPFDAELCGGEHGILIGHSITSPRDANQRCPEFIWLSAKDGAISARTALPDLTHPAPRFGPLIAYKDRLWTFFGTSTDDPHRDLIELEPQGEADRPGQGDSPAADDPWLAHAHPELRETAAAQLPKWSLFATAHYGGFGKIPEVHGEKDLIALPANGDSPVAFARRISVPKSGNARLQMRLGNEPNHHWRLVVRFGEKLLLDQDMDWSKNPQVFKDLSVDLKPVAGQTGWLVVEARFVDHGDHTRTYWKRLDVEL